MHLVFWDPVDPGRPRLHPGSIKIPKNRVPKCPMDWKNSDGPFGKTGPGPGGTGFGKNAHFVVKNTVKNPYFVVDPGNPGPSGTGFRVFDNNICIFDRVFDNKIGVFAKPGPSGTGVEPGPVLPNGPSEFFQSIWHFGTRFLRNRDGTGMQPKIWSGFFRRQIFAGSGFTEKNQKKTKKKGWRPVAIQYLISISKPSKKKR